MRLFIIAMLLVSAAMAFTVKPDYYGIQDTGSETKPTMDIDITIDCDTKDLIVKAAEDVSPIEGADTVLFYTDYGYQPLPNPGKTDADGMVTMPVTGTLDFLTGLFILRVDHDDYQSREIEFGYEKCFEEPPPEPEEEPEEEPPPAEPEEEPEAPPVEEEVPEENITEPEVAPPENVTPPEEPEEEAEAPVCPLGVLLLSSLIFKARR